jgi:hypothetical protein
MNPARFFCSSPLSPLFYTPLPAPHAPATLAPRSPPTGHPGSASVAPGRPRPALPRPSPALPRSRDDHSTLPRSAWGPAARPYHDLAPPGLALPASAVPRIAARADHQPRPTQQRALTARPGPARPRPTVPRPTLPVPASACSSTKSRAPLCIKFFS